MIRRNALADFRSVLEDFPVVALLGSRQVGKPTLALYLAETTGEDRSR